ncbi:hypothetical protein OC846_003016 [Tilletia horrida]|uniref:glucan 1,3-beta-glucosidase n=1 Tax=Tilletia horrida TaxID=155126 RepID=A0AAN6GTC4_9BASI|nr:hypothetical protein OC846_003016 [Tilletia horrida]
MPAPTTAASMYELPDYDHDHDHVPNPESLLLPSSPSGPQPVPRLSFASPRTSYQGIPSNNDYNTMEHPRSSYMSAAPSGYMHPAQSTDNLYPAANTPGRNSDAHQSWYSNTPLAEAAAQHSVSSPLARDGLYEKDPLSRQQQQHRSGGLWAWCKRKPWLALLLLVLLIGAIGGAIGGVTGAMNRKDSSKSSTTDNNNNNTSNNNGGSTPDAGSGKTPSGTNQNETNAAPPAPTITPLPAWNWTDPRQKVMGVSLGNYLAIERWLDEDWFRSVAGEDSWDEWDLHKNLGPQKAVEVLQAHQQAFIQESDVEELAEYGMNTIRVPLPFWSLIPTQGNEPYNNASQLDRLSDIMTWAYKRNMYVIVDLHSMPGSQSGDQASGHNTSNPQFFSSTNQQRSIQTVTNLIQWIGSHPYKSVVSGVCPVNEPKAGSFAVTDMDKMAVLRQFYSRAYKLLSQAQLPMIFHPSFIGNPQDYWLDFVTGKDPNMLIYTIHPYPGFFPENSDQSDITNKVCNLAQSSVGYPVPILYGEWSLISGIQSNSYMRQYYISQLSAYSWSAGSLFWTYKAPVTQNPVLANPGLQETMFSFKDLLGMGLIPKPASKLSTNPTDYGAYNFVNSLSNPACGRIPVSQIGWKNPAVQGNSYSGRRRRRRQDA